MKNAQRAENAANALGSAASALPVLQAVAVLNQVLNELININWKKINYLKKVVSPPSLFYSAEIWPRSSKRTHHLFFGP